MNTFGAKIQIKFKVKIFGAKMISFSYFWLTSEVKSGLVVSFTFVCWGSIVVYHSLIVSCQTEVQTGLYSSSGRFPGCRRLSSSRRDFSASFGSQSPPETTFAKENDRRSKKAFYRASMELLHRDNNTIYPRRPSGFLSSAWRITTIIWLRLH